MTAQPPALFDNEPLRACTVPILGVPLHDAPLVVLGSSQDVDDLDEVATRRDGVAVRRRRGGGGAVLLHPEDAWIELWLPRRGTEPLDVRASARRVGGWWCDVLRGAGIRTDVHDGSVLHADQGAVACFAAIGPGELTVDGAKLVGLSQWRVREGTLVSSVLAVRPPCELGAYLARRGCDVPLLAQAASLSSLGVSASAAQLVATFCARVVSALPDATTAQLRTATAEPPEGVAGP